MDFSKYVTQFRGPQSYTLGPTLRALRDQQLAQEQTDNQVSQYNRTRNDANSQYAAEFSRDQGKTKQDAAMARYKSQLVAIDAATKAANGGQWNEADSMVPRVLELGGEATRSVGPDGKTPVYRFKAGAAPTAPELDVQGARQQIFGGNPYDRLPGASAAAMPSPSTGQRVPPSPASAAQSPPIQTPTVAPGAPLPGAPGEPPPDAAGPPPGPARSVAPPGSVWLPPGMDPGPQPEATAAPAAPSPTPAEADLAALDAAQSEPEIDAGGQTGQPGSEQSTGPNPFNPPGIDPYTIDPTQVKRQNELRLDPFLKGLVAGVPSRFRSQVEQYAAGLSGLNLPPAETLKLTEEYFKELSGMYRGEVAAEGQAGRLEQMGAHQESIQADKDRDRGFRRAKELTNLDNLKETKRKIEVSRGVEDLLKVAHRNGASATALIRQVYNMYTSGVMTDRDFVDTKEGIQTLWQAVKNQAVEKLFNPNGGGLAPPVVANLKELVEIALRGHRRTAMAARDSLYRAYKGTQNKDERDAIGETLRAVLAEEYYPPEFLENYTPGSADVPTYEPGDEQETMKRLEAGENLGVKPLPGQPNMGREPSRAGAVRGSKVPPKPPRKAVKDMNREELKAAAAEELRKFKEEESGAP